MLIKKCPFHAVNLQYRNMKAGAASRRAASVAVFCTEHRSVAATTCPYTSPFQESNYMVLELQALSTFVYSFQTLLHILLLLQFQKDIGPTTMTS